MMLTPSGNLPNTQDRFSAMMRGWVAVDTESGAHLSVSHGRTSRAAKYILILPNKTIQERGGLFGPCDWDYPEGRKFVRAWNSGEAIELANEKLRKMLLKRQPAVPITA
jgi:hypothetical protein